MLLLALVTVHKLCRRGVASCCQILPGVLFTFALWVAGGVVFGRYLAEFARNYVTTYAGLASVMIALVFLYMVAAIFIFGGELNQALSRAAKRRAAAKAGFARRRPRQTGRRHGALCSAATPTRASGGAVSAISFKTSPALR